MTALPKVSKFQIGMKEGFNPVLTYQIYSPNFTCFCAAGRLGEGCVFGCFSSHGSPC